MRRNQTGSSTLLGMAQRRIVREATSRIGDPHLYAGEPPPTGKGFVFDKRTAANPDVSPTPEPPRVLVAPRSSLGMRPPPPVAIPPQLPPQSISMRTSSALPYTASYVEAADEQYHKLLQQIANKHLKQEGEAARPDSARHRGYFAAAATKQPSCVWSARGRQPEGCEELAAKAPLRWLAPARASRAVAEAQRISRRLEQLAKPPPSEYDAPVCEPLLPPPPPGPPPPW